MNRRHLGLTLAGAAIIVAATVLLTPFRPPEEILAERTWGIGRSSTSVMTGFATGKPWWRHFRPSGLARNAEGELPGVVRIDRDEMVELDDVSTLPHRSIGYDAVLGAFTAIRSGFSDALVYDWWAIVRFQQGVLILAQLAPFLILVASTHRSHRRTVAVVYSVGFVALLLSRPFENEWLIDGILDSALAAPAALIGVPLVCMAAHGDADSSRAISSRSVLAGLLLGLLTMIRGELAIAFLFALAVSAVWEMRIRCLATPSSPADSPNGSQDGSRSARPAFVATAALLAVPLCYGFVNVAIHGHFVPFRLQSGQNLVEPVGEFENPWGIEYSDEWMNSNLRSRGIDYISFEADTVLTRQYLDMLVQEPLLFVRNFVLRLERLRKDLAFGMLGPVTLPVLLVLALWLGRRIPQARVALVPLVLSIGLVLFHAWFGSPSRVLAPVRFLMAGALCAGLAATAAWLVETHRHRVLKSSVLASAERTHCAVEGGSTG